MEPGLEEILNLLLESEQSGVVALDWLAAQVENDELIGPARAALRCLGGAVVDSAILRQAGGAVGGPALDGARVGALMDLGRVARVALARVRAGKESERGSGDRDGDTRRDLLVPCTRRIVLHANEERSTERASREATPCKPNREALCVTARGCQMR